MAEKSKLRELGCLLLVASLGGFLSSACSDEGAQPSATTAKGSASSPAAEPDTTPPIAPAPRAEPEVQPTAASAPEDRIEAGRAVYNANCIACHNMDPTKEGALGPSVAGASLELLEARVLRAQYPEGYKPKRDTRVMVALPHLEPQLPVLAAYLDSLE